MRAPLGPSVKQIQPYSTRQKKKQTKMRPRWERGGHKQKPMNQSADTKYKKHQRQCKQKPKGGGAKTDPCKGINVDECGEKWKRTMTAAWQKINTPSYPTNPPMYKGKAIINDGRKREKAISQIQYKQCDTPVDTHNEKANKTTYAAQSETVERSMECDVRRRLR